MNIFMPTSLWSDGFWQPHGIPRLLTDWTCLTMIEGLVGMCLLVGQQESVRPFTILKGRFRGFPFPRWDGIGFRPQPFTGGSGQLFHIFQRLIS